MADGNSTHRDYRFKDLTGSRFGKWIVIGRTANCPSKRIFWTCLCECGTEESVRGDQLKANRSQACKTCSRKRHGMRGAPEYSSWSAMNNRCNNPNAEKFHRYGGNGIAVCERWRSFGNFYADMGPKPSASHSIDRIDGSKGYGPENCRWATPREQSINRSSVRMLTHQGETMCMKDLALKFGIGASCFRKRLLKGWSIERALTEPVKTSR